MFGRKKQTPNAPIQAPSDDPVHIRVRALEKSFGQNHILRGVDVDLYRGKINIIIGGSGQGKSVLLRHVIGLIKPDKGQVFIDGQDIVPLNNFELEPIRKQFGMLFQYAALFDSMTVLDNVAFPLREHTKLSERDIRETVKERLEQLGLRGSENKFPAELSGGMKKRVGLARALALKPSIIIYDEPTTGLDPVLTKSVDDMILETARRENATSLIISHDMASTFRIGDHIAMLYEGRIVAQGSPAEIKASEHPALRAFLEVSKVAV